MKNLLLIVTCTLLCINVGIGQDAEIDAIKTTLNYYLEGGTNNDFETLEKAFHPDARMTYLREGYQDVNAVEFFKGIMKPGPAQNRKTMIEHVDYSGHAAHARLRIDYEKFSFIDYMNLLKVDGEWKIVSKIFYRDQH